MEDTWASRDLPVLDAVVSQLDQLSRTGSLPDGADLAAATGFDLADVAAALEALDGTYIELKRTLGDASGWFATKVTPDARRAVGQWPTGESLIEHLTAGLERAAEQEKDPEQKRRLRVVARELGGAAKAIAINVAEEMLKQRLPH